MMTSFLMAITARLLSVAFVLMRGMGWKAVIHLNFKWLKSKHSTHEFIVWFTWNFTPTLPKSARNIYE